MQLLKDTIKLDLSLLHYLPFMVEGLSKEVIDSHPDFEDCKHFIFIGNGKHAPNTRQNGLKKKIGLRNLQLHHLNKNPNPNLVSIFFSKFQKNLNCPDIHPKNINNNW
jgi:hypothetical protein